VTGVAAKDTSDWLPTIGRRDLDSPGHTALRYGSGCAKVMWADRNIEMSVMQTALLWGTLPEDGDSYGAGTGVVTNDNNGPAVMSANRAGGLFEGDWRPSVSARK
jgi:hypothetical protein